MYRPGVVFANRFGEKVLKHRGFTLVETLVSTATLMIFFGATVAIFQVVTNLVGESRVRVVASELATQRIEEARNLAYIDVGTVGGIPQGSMLQSEVVSVNGQDFELNTGVVFIDDPFDDQAPVDVIPTDYKRVRIAVSWQGPFESQNPVVMITDIVPNGLETNVGGGSLFVNVINASGAPVANADVHIFNSSVVPQIDLQTTTDASGRVLLPGAPACNDCYEISATRGGFTLDRTYSTTEVANPLKPHPGVIEEEVTSITLAIAQASTITFLTTGPRENNYPPFSGVQFTLRGAKIIGTNALDEPVLKYEQAHSSGAGGQVVVSGLEWDTYEIFIPEPSSVDFAGSWPISPFSLLPGSNASATIVTRAATANNLLLVIRDSGGGPIATASATINGPGSFVATGSAGIATQGDRGQVLFSGLSAGLYDIGVSKLGFLDASASANVSGDTKEILVMQNE